MSSEDQMRALLEDSVAGVEPRRSLETIRARTSAQRHRRRAGGVMGAVVATAATIAVVAALTHGLGSTTGDSPAASRDRSTAASGPESLVYFVGETGSGARLFAESHRASSAEVALDEAVSDAVAGRATDPDYHSPWPTGTTLERAQLSDGVLSVDLSGPVAGLPAGTTRADASLALQQLVYTAQNAVEDTLPVTFLLNGQRTRTLLGEPTDRPLPAAIADDTLASVSVTSPQDGATVSSPFTVQGRAAAFEGNVQWELVQGENELQTGWATAAECCTLSPYSFTVKAPPGDYTLVVHDDDVSDGEGNAPTQDTKQVTVR